MKVLISAYACEPGKGSEPEVGWQWVRQIARHHQTWVLTRANNQSTIEVNLRHCPEAEQIHFEYLDLPAWVQALKRGRSGVHAYYYLWQLEAFRRSRRLHQQVGFDLAHHLTFINMYMGPGVALLNVPFVWGPVGANPFIPASFWPALGLTGNLENLARLGIRYTAPLRDPLLDYAYYKAGRILTISQEIQNRLSPRQQDKSLVMAQNAVERNLVRNQPRTPPHTIRTGSLRFLAAGQLVSIKNFSLALQAFARHLKRHPRSKFTLVGDGKEKTRLRAESLRLGLGPAVSFTGTLPRKEVFAAMDSSDVFVFPSFEGAGLVVLEALARALPVLCLDFGGPGEYVTEACGLKAPADQGAETAIAQLARAMDQLAVDPKLYGRLSAGALKQVIDRYTWDGLGERLDAVYRTVLMDSQP